MKRIIATSTCLLLVLPFAAKADYCMVVDQSEMSRPGTDGPGSFGQLQDTMSLGCLDYIGATQREDSIVAILRDHNERRYEVTVGEYVGENSGRVVQITNAVITIEQIVRGVSGEHEKLTRFVHRRLPAAE